MISQCQTAGSIPRAHIAGHADRQRLLIALVYVGLVIGSKTRSEWTVFAEIDHLLAQDQFVSVAYGEYFGCFVAIHDRYSFLSLLRIDELPCIRFTNRQRSP